MIARITRTLLLLQTIGAVALVAVAIQQWHMSIWLALIFGFGAIFLLRVLITANSFFLAWLYRSETPLTRRLSWRQALRLFKEEFNATLLSSSWSMPFYLYTGKTFAHSVEPPVLFIHGYGCNSGYWSALGKILTQAEISHRAVDLTPVLGDIDDYVPILHDAVEKLCNETGSQKIIMIAHSMGGLAARAYLRKHGSRRVAKILTLGTPHHGTGLANSAIGINSRQMRWTGKAQNGAASAWLLELEKAETKELRSLFVSIYSHHDNIIAPQTSSFLPDAKNIEFHGIGHVALALNPVIQACVLEEIRQVNQQPKGARSAITT